MFFAVRFRSDRLAAQLPRGAQVPNRNACTSRPPPVPTQHRKGTYNSSHTGRSQPLSARRFCHARRQPARQRARGTLRSPRAHRLHCLPSRSMSPLQRVMRTLATDLTGSAQRQRRSNSSSGTTTHAGCGACSSKWRTPQSRSAIETPPSGERVLAHESGNASLARNAAHALVKRARV